MADKKKSVLCVLDVLKRYSDENHKLSQKDIAEYLKKDHGLVLNRKTIKSDIITLIECGYNIECDDDHRSMVNKKTGEVDDVPTMTNLWLVNDFDESELKLLIDTVIFSPNIDANQSKALIDKLTALTSENFNPRIKYVSSLPGKKNNNKGLFYTVTTIDEAIAMKCKISYKRIVYDIDVGFHPKQSSKGKDLIYVVSPYQIAMSEGKYYLIGGNSNGIVHIDLDRIRDVKILEDQEIIPFKSLKNSNGQSLNLKEYMNEHIFMASGEPIRVRLKIVKPLLYDVIDTFGKDITIVSDEDALLVIDVKAAEKSIEQFIRRFTPQVTVMEPVELQDKIAALFAISTAATKNGYKIKKKDD